MDDEIKNDETIFKLVEIIKMQFENEVDLYVWTKALFKKVSFY